jgi:hypothetical protein
MATQLAPNDIVAARMVVVAGNQDAIVTVNFAVVSIGTPPATDKDFADVFSTAVGVPLRACMDASANYHGTQAQILGPPLRQVDVISTNAAGVGSAGASALPRQVSGVISWYTQKAGRAFRGRSYIPFPTTADMDADVTPTAGYVVRLEALAVQIAGMSAIAVGGRTAVVEPVIYHVHKPPIFTNFDPIIAHTSNKKWGTQRRRGNYGRPNISPF